MGKIKKLKEIIIRKNTNSNKIETYPLNKKKRVKATNVNEDKNLKSIYNRTAQKAKQEQKLQHNKSKLQKNFKKYKDRQTRLQERALRQKEYLNKEIEKCDDLENMINKAQINNKDSVKISRKYNSLLILMDMIDEDVPIGFKYDFEISEIKEKINLIKTKNDFLNENLDIILEKQNKLVKNCEEIVSEIDNNKNLSESFNITLQNISRSKNIQNSIKHLNKFLNENKLNINNENKIKTEFTSEELILLKRNVNDIKPLFLSDEKQKDKTLVPEIFNIKEKALTITFYTSLVSTTLLLITIIGWIIAVPSSPVLYTSLAMLNRTISSYERDFNYLKSSLEQSTIN